MSPLLTDQPPNIHHRVGLRDTADSLDGEAQPPLRATDMAHAAVSSMRRRVSLAPVSTPLTEEGPPTP